MELLINPNVSYVLLILGFMTAVLALFSPGTGFLELGALFALGLAGYGIASLPVNNWAFAFIGVGVLLFCLVLFLPPRLKPTLMTLSALVFMIGATLLFRSQTSWLPVINPGLIILLAPTTPVITWFLARKISESVASQPSFDLDRLIGMTGKASSDIRGQGTVYVNGEEWSALSQAFIPAGSPVRVLKRQGLTLEVEPISPR